MSVVTIPRIPPHITVEDGGDWMILECAVCGVDESYLHGGVPATAERIARFVGEHADRSCCPECAGDGAVVDLRSPYGRVHGCDTCSTAGNRQ